MARVNDQELQKLKTQTTEWADNETKRLQNEADFLDKVLKNRGIHKSVKKNLKTITSEIDTDLETYRGMSGGTST